MKVKTKIFAVLALLVLSMSSVAGAAFAQQGTGETKPGWGWGDPNHEHTGPPGGPSVHPQLSVESEVTAEVTGGPYQLASDQTVETETQGNKTKVSVMTNVFFQAVDTVASKIKVATKVIFGFN